MTKKELQDQWRDTRFRIWEALKGVDATPGRIMGFWEKARYLEMLMQIKTEMALRENHSEFKTQLEELSDDT